MGKHLALLGPYLSLACTTIKAVSYQVVLMRVRPVLPEHYRTVLLALLDNHWSVVCHLESKLHCAYLCGITSGIFGSLSQLSLYYYKSYWLPNFTFDNKASITRTLKCPLGCSFHSNLLCCTVSDEEKKTNTFYNMLLLGN